MMDRKMKTAGSGSIFIPVPFQMKAMKINPNAARKVMGSAFFHMVKGLAAISSFASCKNLKMISKDLMACHPPKYKANAGSKGSCEQRMRIETRLMMYRYEMLILFFLLEMVAIVKNRLITPLK